MEAYSHSPWCQAKALAHTDAAKRVSDTYELHRMARPLECIGKWFACALLDGTTDGVLYDSKGDAVRHQHHNEMYYAYVMISPGSMDACAAEAFLKIHRMMYDKGIRLHDPDDRDHGGLSVVPRMNAEDMRAAIKAYSRGNRRR